MFQSIDLRIFARSCHVGIRIRFWENPFARPPRTALLSIFLVLSVCEYRPGNGLSEKTLLSQVRNPSVPDFELSQTPQTTPPMRKKMEKARVRQGSMLSVQSCRPSRGESRRVGPSSSSRVGSSSSSNSRGRSSNSGFVWGLFRTAHLPP